MKYEVGQKIVHCRDGLAMIDSITKIGDKDYYVIRADGSSSTSYVPMETANQIIRNLLTVNEANEVIGLIKSIELDYNTNTKQRRDNFKRRLNGGTVVDVCYMFKQLYFFKHQENLKDPIKYGPVDIEMLETASNNLLNEFSIVLGINRDGIEDYITNKIK